MSTAERTRIDRFASLLGGASEAAPPDLLPLLTLTSTLRRIPLNGDADPEFRRRLRTRLVAVATVRPANMPVIPEQRSRVANAAPAVRIRKEKPAARSRGSRRVLAFGGALASVMTVTAVGVASTGAAPGSMLYGVKRATESARLQIAGDDTARGKLDLTFAGRRLAEAIDVSGNQARLVDALNDMDAQTRQGARLLTAAAIAEQTRTPLDMIDAFVGSQRARLGALLPTTTDTRSRERIIDSLLLVERLRTRAIALRATLLCTVTKGGGDDLGALPGPCDRTIRPASGVGSTPANGQTTRPGATAPSPAAAGATGSGASGTGSGVSGATGSSTPGGVGGTKTPPVPVPNATGAIGQVAADVVDQVLGTIGLSPLPPVLPSPPSLP